MRELNIATGSGCNAKKWVNRTITFDDLCDKLAVTSRTPERSAEYPHLQKADRDRIKDHGGFVGGYLKDGLRRRENVASRSMLTMDVDNATPDFFDRFMHENTLACCLYTTHSHRPEAPRMRILVPLSRDVTAEEYAALARYYAAQWGIDLFDECSFRPQQLMYWPTTSADGEYIFRRLEGTLYDVDAFFAATPEWKDLTRLPLTSREDPLKDAAALRQADPLTKEGVIGAFCRTYTVSQAIDKFLQEVYEPSLTAGRYDYIPAESSAGVVIYEEKFAYSHHASDPAAGHLLNAFDLVRIHLFPDENEKASLDAMMQFASADENVRRTVAAERRQKAEQLFSGDAEADDWQQQLEYDRRTMTLKNTLQNVTLILQNDPSLRGIVFNELLDGMEITGQVPWQHQSRYWRDADDAQLISYIDSHYGSFSDRHYDVAVTKVADDRSYHPIRNYIASLPPWDGVKRLETLLIDYLGAEDTEYVRAVTRKTLCAAILRVRDPGIKFDTMPVLNGPQGIGKSTLIAKLGGQWFSDSLSLNDTKDKTAAEKLQGYWIIEIGELAGMRKAEVETLRSFISRQNDIYRASFGRRATPHPRQCVFFGTTNAESGYLRDICGNRRFWPVRTPGGGRKSVFTLSQEEVDQIWAEALCCVNAGEQLFLDARLEALAGAEQRDAMETDDREGIVKEYLDVLLPVDWPQKDLFDRRNYLSGAFSAGEAGTRCRDTVCCIEIWCEAFGKDRANLKRSDSNELIAILLKLGWQRKPKKERIAIYGPQFLFTRPGKAQADDA